MNPEIGFIRDKYEIMQSNVEFLEQIPGTPLKLIDRYKSERDRYWQTLQDLIELEEKRKANGESVDPE